MRHDYDLPPEWDAMTDEEKSRWMTQERCRRQAQRQAEAQGREEIDPTLEETKRRSDRKLEARGYEPVRQKR